MRSQLVLCILGVAASACWAEQASCSDDDDDRSCLLQGSVGVASAFEFDDDGDQFHLIQGIAKVSKQDQHEEKAFELDNGEHDQFHLIQGIAKVSNHKARDQHEEKAAEMDEESEGIDYGSGWEGLANLMKKDKLMKDFDGVEAASASYRKMVHHHVNAMTAAVKPSMEVAAIRSKLKILFIELQKASQQVSKALHKVTVAWVTDFGRTGPLIGAANMTAAMKNVLMDIDAHSKALLTAFYAESQALGRKVNNATLACSKTKHSMKEVFHKAAGLAKSVGNLSTNSLSKKLQAAKEMLPKVPAKEIDKILNKASLAADRLLRVLTPSMKDIASGVAKAFEKHCDDLPHYTYSGAGQAHANILLLPVFALASFFL